MSESRTLLFIDDDAAYMAVANHVLGTYPEKQFHVIWKRTGQEALEELKANPGIDMIILDYYLQDLSGFNILRHIRDENISVPIVLLTSQREFQLAIEALRYGVEDYLLKDDSVGLLLPRTILNLLERATLKRQISEQQRADLITRKQTDAIRELVVTVCHEFNNPLAAIKISTDILMRQWLSEEERELIKTLDGNISKVEREIQHLRNISFE
jgi:DNA-binding response OmpR family regulator